MEKNQKDTRNPKGDSASKGKTNMDLGDTTSAKETRQNTKKSNTEHKTTSQTK